MLKKGLLVKTLAVCVGVVGLAQADVIHETTQWQSIGIETIADGKATNSNNGVYYSTDGKLTWEMLGAATEFELGQTVDFKVEIYKEFQGTHLSDVAKVWIDGTEEGFGEWALATNGNEKTGSLKTQVWIDGYWSWSSWRYIDGHFEDKWVDYTTPYYQGNVVDGSQTQGLGNDFIGEILFDYTFSEERDYELIARAMCSDDLSGVDKNDGSPVQSIMYVDYDGKVKSKNAKVPTSADWVAFTSTNPISTPQGEIESYTIRAIKHNVPEPTLLSLLGCGLLGLAFLRRKKSK